MGRNICIWPVSQIVYFIDISFFEWWHCLTLLDKIHFTQVRQLMVFLYFFNFFFATEQFCRTQTQALRETDRTCVPIGGEEAGQQHRPGRLWEPREGGLHRHCRPEEGHPEPEERHEAAHQEVRHPEGRVSHEEDLSQNPGERDKKTQLVDRTFRYFGASKSDDLYAIKKRRWLHFQSLKLQNDQSWSWV